MKFKNNDLQNVLKIYLKHKCKYYEYKLDYGTNWIMAQTGLWHTLTYILSHSPILYSKVFVGFLNYQIAEQFALLCQTDGKEIVRIFTF
jgi:hypothetical protein